MAYKIINYSASSINSKLARDAGQDTDISTMQSNLTQLALQVSQLGGEVLVTSEDTEIGSVDEPLVLTKNAYHKYGSLTALYFSLPSNAVATDDFTIEFTCGGSVGYPNTIKWVETPSFTSGNTYIVSIQNNLGLVAEFANS